MTLRKLMRAPLLFLREGNVTGRHRTVCTVAAVVLGALVLVGLTCDMFDDAVEVWGHIVGWLVFTHEV